MSFALESQCGSAATAGVASFGCGESLGFTEMELLARAARAAVADADLTLTAASYSGGAAYAMADLSAADVAVAALYDAFTISSILFLEDLGFFAKSEGGRFVENGTIAPGGRLAVNTNGGGLCCTPRHTRHLCADRGGAPAAR